MLQPYKDNKVNIKYIPTHYAHNETCDVTISTKEIGDWRYYLCGKGTKP
jgi:hypothetical protein